MTALTLMGGSLLAALYLPLVSGALALLMRRDTVGNLIAQWTLIIAGALGLFSLALFSLGGAPEVLITQGSILALAISPLSAFFLGIVYLGMLLTAWYALGYLPRYQNAYSLPWLNLASGFFLFGMQGVVLSGSPFAFLLFWEVMSVAAYFLVIADRSDESLRAGFLYFIMTHIGYACLLAGFLLLARGHVFASWSTIAFMAGFLPPSTLAAAFLLLLIGFGSKAGLVPLHQWLPYAHPQAPSHSSALLSGTMLKVALFGFVLSLALFPALPLWWGVLVILLGLVSALFGVLYAAVEHDAKRLLAWSSIENMGLLFSGVGVIMVLHTLPGSPAIQALIFGITLFVALHVINHFLFKTGLFMAVGAVVSGTHTRDLDLLGGLARTWPLFSGAFLALCLAAAALPPFGTFFGEWAYLQSLAVAMSALPVSFAIAAGIILLVIALVSGLAIFTFVKLFSTGFLGRARSDAAEQVHELPKSLVLPSLACAALSALVGVVALPLAGSSGAGISRWMGDVTLAPSASINGSYAVFSIVCALLILALVRAFATNTTPARETGTWDCGAPLTPRMEYTATGFAAPVRFFFRTLLLSQSRMIVEPISSENPWIARRRIEWSTASFWEHALYRPIARGVFALSMRVRKLQSGVIQAYLLLVLAALILVIFFAL